MPQDASTIALAPRLRGPERQRGASIVIDVAGVSKHYDGKAALENASFRVRGGEMVALLGPSGAGKTSLIRCMTGLAAPDRGVVRLDGRDVATLRGADRRRIAVVFQQFNLVTRLTALDNVLAGRLGHVPAWRGILRRFARADRLRALECLQRVGLLDRATQRADTLSGGQQQRVAIARALVQQPEMIVADEPIASLDPHTGEGILELLHEICHVDGVAVVCSLHQTSIARRFADRIVGMAHGRIRFDLQAAAFDECAAAALYAGSTADATSPPSA